MKFRNKTFPFVLQTKKTGKKRERERGKRDLLLTRRRGRRRKRRGSLLLLLSLRLQKNMLGRRRNKRCGGGRKGRKGKRIRKERRAIRSEMRRDDFADLSLFSLPQVFSFPSFFSLSPSSRRGWPANFPVITQHAGNISREPISPPKKRSIHDRELLPRKESRSGPGCAVLTCVPSAQVWELRYYTFRRRREMCPALIVPFSGRGRIWGTSDLSRPTNHSSGRRPSTTLCLLFSPQCSPLRPPSPATALQMASLPPTTPHSSLQQNLARLLPYAAALVASRDQET